MLIDLIAIFVVFYLISKCKDKLEKGLLKPNKIKIKT